MLRKSRNMYVNEYCCVCPNCGEFGYRSQYGQDYECPNCGEELNWENEAKVPNDWD